MRIRFWLHLISQNLGRIFHIVRSEHNRVGVSMISIFAHVLKRVDQIEADLPTQIFSRGKLVLLRHLSEVSVVNEALKSHVLNELSH